MTKLTTTYYLTCVLLLTTFFKCFSQFKYADSIFIKGEYTLAALEYERIISLYDNDSIFAFASLKKVECLKRNNQFSEALGVLDNILPYNYGDSINFATKYEIILCSLLDNQPEYALKHCEQLKTIVQDTNLHNKILFLEIIANNEVHNWNEALIKTKQYFIYKNCNINADSLYAPILKYKFCEPLKAKKLSYYLPGLGQLYAKNYRDAANSLILQSAFAAFTVYSIMHGYYFSSLFTGIGNLKTFYLGGAVHAYHLAENKNDTYSYKFNNQIKYLILNIEHDSKQ